MVKLEPSNIQGQHNLCVVYVEQGDLAKAERCLVKVLKMAPEEIYVKQHLQIVRNRLKAKNPT